MPFADVFSGFEGAASDHYSKLLEMQYGQRRDAAAAIAKMADDPRFDEQSQMALKHRALDIIGGDPMKPLSSKDIDVSSILVRPPAPPPVKAPGGPGLQNMPIGQQLSGQETAGGPAPQASPNTGPTSQMASQTIQAPTPPPHPADQMMSFDEQMRRAAAASSAKSTGQFGIAEMKAMQPQMMGGPITIQGPDGKRYKQYNFKQYNPGTGQSELHQWVDPNPVADFAIRNGQVMSASNIAALVKEGYFPAPTDQSDKPIDIDALARDHPDQLLRYIDANRVVPTTAEERYLPINGQTTPVNPYTSKKGASLGTAPGGMGTVRDEMRANGVDAQGHTQFTPVTETTTKVPIGAAPAPTPPPTAQPQGQNAPGGGLMPPEFQQLVSQKILTPELLQFLQQKNPQMSPEALKESLVKYAGFQDATQGSGLAQPVPPPQAPPMSATPAPNAPPMGLGSSAGAGGFDKALFNTEQSRMIAIRPATTALIGNPENPYYQSMESFGPLMDKAQSRQKVGIAMRVITEGLADIEHREGPNAALHVLGLSIGAGGFSKMVTNFLGLPALQAQGEATALEQTLRDMSPQEKDMVTNLIAGYASVVGYRSLTKGSAYKFSTDIMEKELPIPGVSNVNSSRDYYNKLATLLEEPAVDIDKMKTISPEEKDFYKKAAIRLSVKGRAERTAGNGKYFLVGGKWVDENGQEAK